MRRGWVNTLTVKGFRVLPFNRGFKLVSEKIYS